MTQEMVQRFVHVPAAPGMVYHFKNFSLVSLLANPLVLPLQPLVLLLDPETKGCPAACPEVLSLPGYTLLRTDQSGWIEVSTDGKRMWVAVERSR